MTRSELFGKKNFATGSSNIRRQGSPDIRSDIRMRLRMKRRRHQRFIELTGFEYMAVFKCGHYVLDVSCYLEPPDRNFDSREALRNVLVSSFIIRQSLCPVVGRRPQHAVSKLPCIVLSAAISCRSSICLGRLSTAWLVSLVVFSCHIMVSKW